MHAPEFNIGLLDGVVRVVSPLDREQKAVYELQIEAYDTAPENPLRSVVNLTVNLQDINDNAPVFTPSVYRVGIREDLPTGAVVMIVSARDDDLGGNGTVRYSLIGGASDKFEIDRLTGAIRILEELDYESQQVYNMTVRARDRGDPSSLASQCSVLVEIIDVDENLHGPRFREYVYEARVEENQPVNTTVLTVTATDNDWDSRSASPRDYQVVYSIRNGTGLGVFNIDNQGENHSVWIF